MKSSEQERQLIKDIIASPSTEAPRRAYLGWLEAQENKHARANVLRATLSAIGGESISKLNAALAELEPDELGWSRLVGAQLVQSLHEHKMQENTATWLELTLPSVELSFANEPTTMAELPLGTSHLWGDPDLPEKTAWPTLSECMRWQPEQDLDPDSPCQFIGQLNLAELSNFVGASQLPKTGLLSFFAHHEWDKYGSSGICVRHFADTHSLERIPHAATDAANSRGAPHRVLMTDALSLPDSSGPWKDDLGLDDLGLKKDFDLIDAHDEVRRTSAGTGLGLLGYLRATSGDDPTPSREWLRFICIPVDPDRDVMQHVAIREADLACGNLDAGKLVWVDFDGG